MTRRARVLVATFSIEANSFVRGETTLDDFRRQTFAVGEEIHRDLLGPSSELAGALDVFAAEGLEVVPAVVAQASPGAPVAEEVVDEVVRLTLAACDDAIAGAYVMLHGAAVTRADPDPEGRLLAALRERLGRERPIAISLDHHANLTTRMVDAVDAVTAYRTCPHVDLRERGEQAARILSSAIAGRVRPVCAAAGRPMITPADLHDSSRDPFRSLMALCDAAEADGALAAALLPVDPWIDVPGLGWKAVVTTDGDEAAAAREAEAIVEAAWRERRAFLRGRRLPAADAVAEALASEAPVVVADAGDATNGGSSGDSTELLRALRGADGVESALLTVCDAAAAAAAFAAGPGAELDLTLGDGPRGAYNEAVTLRVRVVAARVGDIRYTHPAADGTRDDPGRAALVRSGGIEIVVHEKPVRVIDPVPYEAVGADVARAQLVQAKSHVSFRAGFARVTTRAVVADTRGPTSANLPSLPFRNRPRPLFPFEDVEAADTAGAVAAAAPRPDAPGLREVAERAGVSKSTASRALANRPGVRAELRDRIIRAANDIGYEPNLLAQSLSKGATMTVGFLVRDIASPALPPILLGAEGVLRAAGYAMLLTNSEGLPALDAEHIRVFRQRRVDGLLLSLADDLFPATIDELQRLPMPFVAIDRELPEHLGASTVTIDHAEGLAAAVGHLFALGHRRIGFVAGPPKLRPTTAASATLAALGRRHRGLSVLVEAGSFTSEHGFLAATRMLSGDDPPSALIAGNGQILLGAVRALRELGLTIPDDVSLVSIDDVPFLEVMTPPVAAIARDQYEIGRSAAELLLARLAGGGPEQRVQPTSFTDRASTAAAAAGGRRKADPDRLKA